MNDDEMVTYLKSARTNTPEQDAEAALRHDRYDATAAEWFESHAHEPYASAA